jgi:hypothetical protein
VELILCEIDCAEAGIPARLAFDLASDFDSDFKASRLLKTRFRIRASL